MFFNYYSTKQLLELRSLCTEILDGKADPQKRADALLLLDANSLYLASYHRNTEAKDILRSSTPYFLTLLDSWKPFKKETGRKQMKVTMNLYSFLFLELAREQKPTGFYFLAMSASGQVDPKKLDEFSKIILSMLSPE